MNPLILIDQASVTTEKRDESPDVLKKRSLDHHLAETMHQIVLNEAGRDQNPNIVENTPEWSLGGKYLTMFNNNCNDGLSPVIAIESPTFSQLK